MKKIFYTFSLIAFMLAGCIDQEDYKIKSLEANPDLALPLAFGEVSISSVLSGQDAEFIKVADDGLVYVEYDRELFSQSILTLFELRNTTFDHAFNLPATTYPASATDLELETFTETIDFGLTPQELEEIYLKQGQLRHEVIMTPFNADFAFEIQINFPEFINQNNSNPLNATLVPGSGIYPLVDHLIDMHTPNQFDVEVKLILKAHNDDVTILNTEIDLSLAFENLAFSYLRGYMGEQSVNDTIQDVLEIQAFGDALNGAEVTFADPKLEINVSNEYGLPVTIDLLNFAGVNESGEMEILTNPPTPISIDYPLVMGESGQTLLSVTNVSELLSFVPTSIYYRIRPRINVGAPVSYDNFIIDTSKVTVNLHLELPIAGIAKGIVIGDTVSLKLEGVDQSNISEAAIKANITNELPLDAQLQFYFLDEQDNVIDSLLADNQKRFIPASEVDINGELLQPGTFDSMIDLDAEKLNVLFAAKKLAIVATLTTSPNSDNTYPEVKFLSQYKLNIELGFRANLKVKLDL